MQVCGFCEAHPLSHSEIVKKFSPWVKPLFDLFGEDRLIFESNFPMDREACAYNVLWNSFKRMAAGFSDAEKDSLFRRTAARTYRLNY